MQEQQSRWPLGSGKAFSIVLRHDTQEQIVLVTSMVGLEEIKLPLLQSGVAAMIGYIRPQPCYYCCSFRATARTVQ
jgi:hypothetical protein